MEFFIEFTNSDKSAEVVKQVKLDREVDAVVKVGLQIDGETPQLSRDLAFMTSDKQLVSMALMLEALLPSPLALAAITTPLLYKASFLLALPPIPCEEVTPKQLLT